MSHFLNRVPCQFMVEVNPQLHPPTAVVEASSKPTPWRLVRSYGRYPCQEREQFLEARVMLGGLGHGVTLGENRLGLPLDVQVFCRSASRADALDRSRPKADVRTQVPLVPIQSVY